ncbi:MAG: amidase family protein [Burkholderiaceae bacterium]|nr:amidase family protein [Burkholderiaceae bacterium]
MRRPHELTLAGAASAIVARRLSPPELLADRLERMAARNPLQPAGIRIAAEAALTAARRLDEEALRSPLHGIPVGVKDVIDVTGRPTTCHSALRFDHVGPLTRRMKKAALMPEAMAGGHDRAGIRAVRRGRRIGLLRHFHERGEPADPEMAAAITAAAWPLAREGAVLQGGTLPPFSAFAAANRAIPWGESAAVHACSLREETKGVGAITRRQLQPGLFRSAGDHGEAERARGPLRAAVDAAFREVDVLLTAVFRDSPCRIEEPAAVQRTNPRQARIACNVTGYPAMPLMSGLSRTGLPLSVRLVAPLGQEGLLLRAARGYERAAGWRGARPPIA